MQRREFLRTAGGAAGATAAAGGAATPAAADGGLAALQEDGNGTDTGPDTEEEPTPGGQTESGDPSQEQNPAQNESASDGGGGGGGSVTVTVGPDGDFTFDPDSVEIPPGTTVVWEWDSPQHNVSPQSQPDGANWEGHPEIVDAPNTYEHTFETEGTYQYVCQPHASAGMEGEIVVSEGASLGGGGGGGAGEETSPAEMGVLLQKHFIGAATFMGIFVTLVFTFYLLKYGESAHSSAPGKRD